MCLFCLYNVNQSQLKKGTITCPLS
jgi:hypothetical protein